MTFANGQYLTYAGLAIIFIAIVLYKLNSDYFKWIKSYWFFDRTWTSRLSSIFYILSLFLMMASLLDLRGPEKRVKASIPDQRTIILIDSSTSMLSEDVRPNRFVKSLQLARHFVKKAAGHQISIVLFSDIQKRLLPFTDDIDLIDSRLAALEKTNSVAGGSNISQAIEEAIQYFEFDTNEDDKNKSGNMLVFTDAEESEGAFKVNIPSDVNLAIVGLGTLKGANIPIRGEDGNFRGYKTFKGEQVITKLEEDYIRQMGKNVKNFKYWIANSFSLPTDEIISFFRTSFSNKQSSGDLRIRPVFSHYILIPAIILYCLSVLLGRWATFKVAKNLMLLFMFGANLVFSGITSNAQAQDDSSKNEKNVTPEIKKDLEYIKTGKADRTYVLKTAEKMLRTKDVKNATELYSEYAKENDSEEVRFNYATSLLNTNRLKDALPIIQGLLKNSKNEDLKDKLRKNLSMHIEQKKNQEKEDQKNKDQKENEQNKDDKKDQGDKNDKKQDQNKEDQENKDKQKKDGKDQKDQKPDKQDGKQGKPEDQKSGKGKNDENKKDEKKEEKKEEGKDQEKDKDKEGEGKEEEKEQEKRPSTIEEKEREIEKKRRMTKTPAMIKQIMSDDRDLQKKMMDTSTNERGEQKKKRDW